MNKTFNRRSIPCFRLLLDAAKLCIRTGRNVMKTTDFLRGLLVVSALYMTLIAITLMDVPLGAGAAEHLTRGVGF